ncbi:FkbM family methyltransferase [Candidatus Pelagibacter bacterium]|nr:FkbM family methyltransferase [Candidatus Pelagibacter bacterium]
MYQKYKKNIFSQNGEDGIILEILKRLKLNKKDKWCCEFGAWDGIHGSNTFNLVKNFNFQAVYIEGDKKRYEDLITTSKKFKKIIPFNKYVSHKKKNTNSLDNILKKTKIVKNFDILSIDIDSFDLAVWKSLKRYRPKIVVIEINSEVPPGVRHEHNISKIGNSFTSTVEFATKNKYQLVCHTGNCIFIDKKYTNKLKINKKFTNNNNVNLLFDTTWFNKKDSFIKKILKYFLSRKVIDFLRNTKKKIK